MVSDQGHIRRCILFPAEEQAIPDICCTFGTGAVLVQFAKISTRNFAKAFDFRNREYRYQRFEDKESQYPLDQNSNWLEREWTARVAQQDTIS